MIDPSTPMQSGGQLFVRYTHVAIGGLPQEFHANGPMIPVDNVDAETHAKAAPDNAEWFEYFRQTEAGAPYSPLEGVPMYFLDATPQEYLPEYGIQGVTMRRSGMRMPFYPEQPYRNAVISSL